MNLEHLTLAQGGGAPSVIGISDSEGKVNVILPDEWIGCGIMGVMTMTPAGYEIRESVFGELLSGGICGEGKQCIAEYGGVLEKFELYPIITVNVAGYSDEKEGVMGFNVTGGVSIDFSDGDGYALINDYIGNPIVKKYYLLNGGDSTKKLEVSGEGTYEIDPDTGIVTFEPERGFSGESSVNIGASMVILSPGETISDVIYGSRPLAFEKSSGETIYDAYDSMGEDFTIRFKIFGVEPSAVGSTTVGEQGKLQTSIILFDVEDEDDSTINFMSGYAELSDGKRYVALDISSLSLVEDATAVETNSISVSGEGTYTLVSSPASVQFQPESDFLGTGVGVSVKIKDVNGMSVVVRYVPEVVAPKPPVGGSSGGGSNSGYSDSEKTSSNNDNSKSGTDQGKTPSTETDKNNSESKSNESATEYEKAHVRAYENGFTKYQSYAEARIFDNLTRSELAKIVSIFATKLYGKTPDESKRTQCMSFADLSDTNSELQGYIVQACELGYMGYERNGVDYLKNFRPTDKVTRAELATTLSRIMRGTKYVPTAQQRWYEGHLNAMNQAGIIKNISDPYKIEIRGDVFIMLSRVK